VRRLRHWRAHAGALIVLLGGIAPVLGQERKPGPLGPPKGVYREQELLVPWERAPGQIFLAHAKLFRPETEAPRPLVVIAHGAPRSDNDRPTMKPDWADAQARWFAAQGFVVAVPMRRGYGRSDGPYQEGPGSCNDPDYFNAGIGTANDTQGVIRYLSKAPYVDEHRVVVVGHSAGAWGALAVASRNPPGIVGVINFAGGRGSSSNGTVCTPPRLTDAAARYGSTARVPSLWVYARNDKFFGPDLARQLFDAYRTAGAPAEFRPLPSFAADGHQLFVEPTGMAEWMPIVTSFLRELRLIP